MRRADSLLLLLLLLVLAATGAVGAHAANARGVHLVARPLHARLVLRASPRGRPLATTGPRALFGDPLVLGVVARRGAWLGVTSELLPNGLLGWVEVGRDVSVGTVRFGIRVDLARRRLDVLRGGLVVRRIPVGVGAPSSPTPLGLFAVAEKLDGARFGATVYGCCILALTARQPDPPAGWARDRPYWVAVHGGGGIGSAVSAGCLHAAEGDLRYLMRTIPLGTPVAIVR